MIRIITGKYGGRHLVTPDGLDVRPTSDRVKTALFNILGDWIEEKRVLDLYAGVGSIGFESLSRGAKHVTFVEKNSISQRCINENAKMLSVQDSIILMKADVKIWLERSHSNYDLIYIDPPYKELEIEEILEILDKSACYNEDTKVIVEHINWLKLKAGQEIAGWVCTRSSKYGKSVISFFERTRKEEAE